MSRSTGVVAIAVSALLAFAATALAQPAAPAGSATPAPSASAARAGDEARKDEARTHFELGLAHFDREEWSAALAEFLKAREIYPTRSATKNAAICLRKENRFDEALDMFEALVRDYPDLSQADRALATEEIAELEKSIGTLALTGAEPGAKVIIDGRDRGTFPLPAPLRLSVGSHVVRVYKEGFLPFEQRVDVASGQAASLEARLSPLTRSGRLRVVEQGGKSLDVVVDNAVVGKTPWEGSVAPGVHTVLLRGEGDVGTQPVSAPVSLDAETPITLVAEELDATARIDPTPGGALVAVDGVALGRGVWEGRLRAGPHRIEVTADGFLPAARNVALAPHERQVFAVQLDRDPTSPLWGRRARPRFALELDGAFATTPKLGGQVQEACAGPCSSSLPVGGLGLLRAMVQLPQGFGFGVEGGYLALVESLDDRPAQLSGSGLRATDTGTVGDRITSSGLLLGGTLLYRRGDRWPFTGRVGVGAYLPTVTDVRSGTFTTSAAGVPPDAAYSVDVSESHGATFVYAAPEVRIGRQLGEHFELSAGVQLLVLAALSQPSWTDQNKISAGPPGQQGDGFGGQFGTQTLAGSIVFVVAPGVGARYDF